MSALAVLVLGVIAWGFFCALVLFAMAVADMFLAERPLEPTKLPCEVRALPSGRLVEIYDTSLCEGRRR